jgi:tRNA threonylcarbamoyladenosine biosynthesis protein TsaB
LRILGLDTATEACSAALWLDGQLLQREVESERGHAGLILTMIDELLAEAGASLRSLDAIAFGRGPGSFTGVRLAASVTQGLAFGSGLPVVAVSDLRAVAQRVNGAGGANSAAMRHVLVCNDARMKEVYWGCFELGTEGLMVPVPAGKERVSKPEEVKLPDAWAVEIDLYGAGRGFAAYPELRAGPVGSRLAGIDDKVLPRAIEIVVLGVAEVRAGRVVAAEEAIPVYLRDDVARPKA